MKSHKIEWCTHTENPFTGCRKGCDYCYARRMAERFAHVPTTVYARVKAETGNPFTPAFHLDRFRSLDIQLSKTRKPRDIFLGSMSDITDTKWLTFDPRGKYPGVIYGTALQENIQMLMQSHPRHTFYVLTKNPRRLIDGWPPNAAIGTSIEDSSAVAEERLHALLNLKMYGNPWVSIEPLLDSDFDMRGVLGAIRGRLLEWVVVGSRTGPSRENRQRIVEAAWRIMEWCKANEVPCLVKENLRSMDTSVKWSRELYPWGGMVAPK